MIVRIKDIDVETVIGVYAWEKKKKQPLIINVLFDYDASKAAKSDKIDEAVNYIELTKKIKEQVEKANFELVEKMVDFVLGMVMEDERITHAEVEIDKPEALRDYALSVSVSGTADR